MSLAQLPTAHPAARSALAADPDTHRNAALRLVPAAAEARGFALYGGLDEASARAAGTDLARVVEALRVLAAELVPTAEPYAAVALAPQGAGGRDVDIVRRALAAPQPAQTRVTPAAPARRTGVVVDLARKRLLLDDDLAPLTYLEFELLQFLVLREGRTVGRLEVIEGLWAGTDREAPSERTIDVHVRRLRAKLGGYDVIVRYGAAPSPDRI